MKLNQKHYILTALIAALVSIVSIAQANHQELKKEIIPPKAVKTPTGSLDMSLLMEREKRISSMIDAAASERAGSLLSAETSQGKALEDAKIREEAMKPL